MASPSVARENSCVLVVSSGRLPSYFAWQLGLTHSFGGVTHQRGRPHCFRLSHQGRTYFFQVSYCHPLRCITTA